MKYDGNEENLYNFVEDKIICWHYGIMSNVIMETAQINLEGKEFEVSVKYEPPACYGENALKVLEDDDFLFLGIGTFSFGISGDEEKDKKEEEIFNSFLDKARTSVNKKNVVVDLRGNTGGVLEEALDLVGAIYFGNDSEKITMFKKFFNTNAMGGKISINSIIIDRAIEREHEYIPVNENFDPFAKPRYMLGNKNDVRTTGLMEKYVSQGGSFFLVD